MQQAVPPPGTSTAAASSGSAARGAGAACSGGLKTCWSRRGEGSFGDGVGDFGKLYQFIVSTVRHGTAPFCSSKQVEQSLYYGFLQSQTVYKVYFSITVPAIAHIISPANWILRFYTLSSKLRC